MSLEEEFQGFSAMIGQPDPDSPDLNEQIIGVTLTCGLCLEPGEIHNGEFVHSFSGRPQCTYRGYL